MIRLKQMLTTDLKMKKIYETNTLPSTCNKKQAKNLDAMNIDDNDKCEIIEEVHKRETFDKYFDIGITSECKYDKDPL